MRVQIKDKEERTAGSDQKVRSSSGGPISLDPCFLITLLLILYTLKVHKIENFFGSEFEFYTISLLVMLKY